MRKITISILTLAAVVLYSCKKDYTCRCIEEEHGDNEETVKILKDVTKNQAKANCVSYEELHDNHNHEVRCELDK